MRLDILVKKNEKKAGCVNPEFNQDARLPANNKTVDTCNIALNKQ